MQLRAGADLRLTPGDFAAHIAGDALVVPEALAELARSHHLRTAEELSGYLVAFPTAVAAALGWQPAQVLGAAGALGALLAGAGAPAPLRAQPRSYGLG